MDRCEINERIPLLETRAAIFNSRSVQIEVALTNTIKSERLAHSRETGYGGKVVRNKS
jgi:hypothetical protein